MSYMHDPADLSSATFVSVDPQEQIEVSMLIVLASDDRIARWRCTDSQQTDCAVHPRSFIFQISALRHNCECLSKQIKANGCTRRAWPHPIGKSMWIRSDRSIVESIDPRPVTLTSLQFSSSVYMNECLYCPTDSFIYLPTCCHPRHYHNKKTIISLQSVSTQKTLVSKSRQKVLIASSLCFATAKTCDKKCTEKKKLLRSITPSPLISFNFIVITRDCRKNFDFTTAFLWPRQWPIIRI